MLNHDPDPRYLTVRTMYDAGHIKCITDLFIYIRKTRIAESIGMSLPRFNKCLNNVEKFSMEELISIGKLFGWDIDRMFLLWKGQHKTQKEQKAKKIKKVH